MKRKKLSYALALLSAFCLWTAAVCVVDVRPVGVEGTNVGLARINTFFHGLIGVHPMLYSLTDTLSLVPLCLAAASAAKGFCQFAKRKSIFKVDRDILILGIYYIAVMTVFAFFELVPVNYRPILIEGTAEVSYPSSTTLLVLCFMPVYIRRLKNRFLRKLLWAFTLFMVTARTFSGVHWITDIIGGVLLSGGLYMMYLCFVPNSADSIC